MPSIKALIAKSLALLLALGIALFFIRDFRGAAFVKKAEKFAEAKQWAEAEEASRAALRQNSTLGLGWYYKGAAEAGQKRTGEAIDDLRRAIVFMANPAVPRLLLGEVQANTGNWTEAREALETALLSNPKPRMAPDHFWQILAECRRRTGDAAGAVPALWMAALTSNFASGTLFPLAESYRVLGHNAPALPDSLALYFAQVYAPDTAMKRWVITHYEQGGHKDLLVAFFEGLIRRGKAEPRDHLVLAIYYTQLRQPQKALDTLAQAASGLGSDPLYYLVMGQAAEQLGDLDTMRGAYRRYLEMNPNAPNRGAIEERIKK